MGRQTRFRKVDPALKSEHIPACYRERDFAIGVADNMVSAPLPSDSCFPDLALYDGTIDSTLALYHTASVKESNQKQTFLNYGQIPETDPYSHLGYHIVQTLIVRGVYAVTHTQIGTSIQNALRKTSATTWPTKNGALPSITMLWTRTRKSLNAAVAGYDGPKSH